MSVKGDVSHFIDCYTLEWTLEDIETGEQHTEYMNNMSLSDFEILYGNTKDNIVWLNLKQQKPLHGESVKQSGNLYDK